MLTGIIHTITIVSNLPIMLHTKGTGLCTLDQTSMRHGLQHEARSKLLLYGHNRMLSQMRFLKGTLSQFSANSLPLGLSNVLFGRQEPTFDEAYANLSKVKFLDPTLNASQQEAVRFALAAQQVALIHGPPGTGKTFTLVELIRQLVLQKKRVLVCGPSNISVGKLENSLCVTMQHCSEPWMHRERRG